MSESRAAQASLDDLALFALVARLGGLSAAARASDTPLPTLSRRMKTLEGVLGRNLFQRGPAGYALTADGRALAEELGGLDEARARVTRWQNTAQGPAPVRITAGSWTARHLARHLPVNGADIWMPVFVPSNTALDLARREADIGLRNQVPEHPWLARRRLPPAHFALFGLPGVTGYIAAQTDTPSQRWLKANHGSMITASASDPRLCLDLARAGRGALVLPLFAAEGSGLTQLSDVIPELTHNVWLVSHQDARHDPPIRAALDQIATLLAG